MRTSILLLFIFTGCGYVPCANGNCVDGISTRTAELPQLKLRAWALYDGIGDIDFPIRWLKQGDCDNGNGLSDGICTVGVTMWYGSDVAGIVVMTEAATPIDGQEMPGWQALAHELLHAAIARRYGNGDSSHSRKEWETLLTQARGW